MKIIVQPQKGGNFKLLFQDGPHVRATGFVDLMETPRGPRPTKYRVRWGPKKDYRHTPSKELITQLRESDVRMVKPDPRFEAFLARFPGPDRDHQRLPDVPARRQGHGPLARKIRLSSARVRTSASTAGSAELRREVSHLGRLGQGRDRPPRKAPRPVPEPRPGPRHALSREDHDGVGDVRQARSAPGPEDIGGRRTPAAPAVHRGSRGIVPDAGAAARGGSRPALREGPAGRRCDREREDVHRRDGGDQELSRRPGPDALSRPARRARKPEVRAVHPAVQQVCKDRPPDRCEPAQPPRDPEGRRARPAVPHHCRYVRRGGQHDPVRAEDVEDRNGDHRRGADARGQRPRAPGRRDDRPAEVPRTRRPSSSTSPPPSVPQRRSQRNSTARSSSTPTARSASNGISSSSSASRRSRPSSR